MQQALYRRYRPSSFADVLGQESVISILREASRQRRFAHAYLFSGPRGSGKTTTARLIAKAANCTNPKDGEPCNECVVCREINEGRNLNIVEIDAASNRGIDEIRALKERVRTVPSGATYKVFIIDEVHMLTTPAFNALLKTLEEPPEHIIIILATTELEKVPATVISRTQQFHFKKVPLKIIVGKLQSISKAENIDIGQDALELIASSAEGSFRDAESLLDQLAAGSNKVITTDDVEHLVGKVGFATVQDCAKHILNGDIDNVLALVSQIADEGHHLPAFAKDLLMFLRHVSVLHISPQMEKQFSRELTDTRLNSLKELARLFDPSKHVAVLKALIEAYGQMRYSQFPIIPLEVALIETVRKQ